MQNARFEVVVCLVFPEFKNHYLPRPGISARYLVQLVPVVFVEPGRNYLRTTYQHIFRHVNPAMRGTAWLMRNRPSPEEIMTFGDSGRAAPENLKV